MAERSAVLVRDHGPVAVVSIDRNERRNTLTQDVLLGLLRALRQIAETPSVRAVVLTGEGRDFSLGGDHGDFMAAIQLPPEEARAYCTTRTDLLGDVILALYSMDTPVIAAVNGQVSGAGISLALACDLRIMDARAKMHLAYGSIGASTDGGLSWFLPRYVGEAKATELLLVQPILRAPQALALGVVHETPPSGSTLPRALEVAVDLARSATHSVRGAKRMLRQGSVSDLQEHLRLEHEQFVAGLSTPEFQMAVRALNAAEQFSFEPQEL